MEGPNDDRLLALADDLTGAGEVAAALMLLETRITVRLLTDPASVTPALPTDDDAGSPLGPLVVDLDSRHRPAADVTSLVRAALVHHQPPLVLAKVDSLLRGSPRAIVQALRADRAPVVVATALPSADRVVLDGVVRLSGVPLHQTDAWRMEPGDAPESVPAALAPVPTRVVGLDTVRSPRLPAVLGSIIDANVVPVCDAETDTDLDRVTTSALTLPSVRFVGSAGLAAALARSLARFDPDGQPAKPVPSGRSHPVLVVVGTAEPVAVEQARRLVAAGLSRVRLVAEALDHDDQRSAAVTRIRTALDAGQAVVTLDPPGDRRTATRTTARRLAEVVAEALRTRPAARSPVDLVLTGGETARRVLDALGIDTLTPVGLVHPGAVHCVTEDGRAVVTRAGSFGDPDSLLDIVRFLHRTPMPTRPIPGGGQTRGTAMSTVAHSANQRPLADEPAPSPAPIIAVTMGDGAGVGPEVVVGALVTPEVAGLCRPVVIGDAARLRAAAAILRVEVDIAPVETVADAVFEPGRINVIDLGLLPADLPWGKLSAAAGEAAYQYIRVAGDLAMKGEVQGICTAPLNKEALHAAGHIYPGHTELLAHLTGTDEVSMMLATPKVSVIHVTTHLGLIDAVHKIEPGLVERTVRRGHEAMVRSGIANPRIGVCGINPHAGENGLFGYGEEDAKIVPAIAVLRADGIDARGPIPADTAFFVAGRGDYDLIVAMYHDQGHGPVKILGIEAGVNITVGLPVIRTSVDHGTAFDIAGKGVAEVGSMIEALRQAALMAPTPAA
ncbi:hypothetical protein GCM10022225_63910 [Plantactinospora mayteni]|uniref:4-hydroxythreonine-4-phosphate dehydrogenase n=1 Tax=Plantactinospora mayteni TaxID=566021 RepID=A0ABQ4F089_9ACTN|nr:4-hydroxythreonine-4-phosphate dehydrogenase PdxA [Plantactinospora mayteni]GIH00320.1 hypothetical protein Pma05_68920 [Plantactinospora mayteni]